MFSVCNLQELGNSSDMQSILSRTNNTGKIKVISVYLTDNSVVTGSSNIQELFDYNEENITAVQIRCPGNYFKKLTVSPEVYLVETEESFKESVFSVIDTGESYEDYPGYSDSPEAPDTSESTPVIGDTTPPEE